MLWPLAAILLLTALTLLTLALRGERVGHSPHRRRGNYPLRAGATPACVHESGPTDRNR